MHGRFVHSLQPPPRSPCRQRDMLQALDGLQMRKQFLYVLRATANSHNFEAVIVIEVDVLRMLKIRH